MNPERWNSNAFTGAALLVIAAGATLYGVLEWNAAAVLFGVLFGVVGYLVGGKP